MENGLQPFSVHTLQWHCKALQEQSSVLLCASAEHQASFSAVQMRIYFKNNSFFFFSPKEIYPACKASHKVPSSTAVQDLEEHEAPQYCSDGLRLATGAV